MGLGGGGEEGGEEEGGGGKEGGGEEGREDQAEHYEGIQKGGFWSGEPSGEWEPKGTFQPSPVPIHRC